MAVVVCRHCCGEVCSVIWVEEDGVVGAAAVLAVEVLVAVVTLVAEAPEVAGNTDPCYLWLNYG